METTLHLHEVVSCPSSSSQDGLWKQLFEKRLDDMSLSYERIHERIRLWDQSHPAFKTPKSGIRYRDGIEVFRVAMGGGVENTHVGFNFCRLYFKDGENHPAYEKYADLFEAGASPRVLQHLPLLNGLQDFIAGLNAGSSRLIQPVSDIEFHQLGNNVNIRSEGLSNSAASMSVNSYSKSVLRLVQGKPAEVKVTFEMVLIDAFTKHKDKARETASKTVDVLTKEWGCSVSRKKISTPDEFERWLDDGRSATRVAFLALDGKKGDRPEQASIDWMKHMEEAQIPYALFSASPDTNPGYTRHGNAMHLLAKAGGSHFHTEPANVPSFDEHWCVGLDLGVGAQYKGKMCVLTLTDGAGRLKAYWRALKDNDEALSTEILEEALVWIIRKAEELSPEKNYVVIRDGRCPKIENIDIYKRLLPSGRSIFVEYVKKGNPIMCRADDQPAAATLCIPKGSSHAFLFTARASQRGMLTNTIKFFSRHNELGYSLEQIGELLSALCFAPKLSFQPSSLPAPVYWADGIASLSYTNLQFCGWTHLANVTRDFR